MFAHDAPNPKPLVLLTTRRWALACLSVLSAEDGARFVRLCRVLEQNPLSIRAALDHLMTLDLVMRNPGYGHPLRPEYILTQRGLNVGDAARHVWDIARSISTPNVVWRKWTGPLLVAVDGPSEFGVLRSRLTPITDRALTAALRETQSAGWLKRTPIRSFPPSVLYARNPSAETLSQAFSAVNSAFQRLACLQ
ncbi:MAG: winged helix-turn-helix transcriptional regulator [Fimbriimonadaceae bacterium]